MTREELTRKMMVVLAAFAAGLALMFAGVAVFDSVWIVGGAFLFMAAAGAFAYHWFRCPACGNSILHYSLRETRAWLRGGPRNCPFCELDLDPAAAEAISSTTT